MNVITLNGNGHHPLPSGTENYLSSGAQNCSRNSELFAAACQLRDAGYNKSDAERELIQCHVTSGSSEREALATIRSVYNSPPREPLTTPKEQARQMGGQF